MRYIVIGPKIAHIVGTRRTCSLLVLYSLRGTKVRLDRVGSHASRAPLSNNSLRRLSLFYRTGLFRER